MGSTIEAIKVGSYNRVETINYIKKNMLNEKYEPEEFQKLLDNYSKYKEVKNKNAKEPPKYPLKNLREVLSDAISKKKCFLDLLKKDYITLFMNHYRSNSSKYGKFYKKFVEAKNDYSDFVQAQSTYPIYKQYIEDYKKEIGGNFSAEFYVFLADLSVFYGLEHEERYFAFIKKSLNYFSVDVGVDQWNKEWRRSELIKLWIEKETNRKKERETKKYLKELLSHKDEDEDDNNYNNNSDNDDEDEDNNYSYNNTHSNYSSSHSNYSYSHPNTHHDIIPEKKTSPNNSNNSSQKKKVKVIVCYACKSKDKCPLCGNKMLSKVSLGNMYAHTNCYDEGKCCLCGKKGPGNQVQSICSNCRKGPSSKGLTGTAKCFICRKLIN